jgi:hypothetical protein
MQDRSLQLFTWLGWFLQVVSHESFCQCLSCVKPCGIVLFTQCTWEILEVVSGLCPSVLMSSLSLELYPIESATLQCVSVDDDTLLNRVGVPSARIVLGIEGLVHVVH